LSIIDIIKNTTFRKLDLVLKIVFFRKSDNVQNPRTHQFRASEYFRIYIIILLHVDPLLGYHREIGDCTAAVARQRPARVNRRMMLKVGSRQQLKGSTTGEDYVLVPETMEFHILEDSTRFAVF
jgi:hypothetical protein